MHKLTDVKNKENTFDHSPIGKTNSCGYIFSQMSTLVVCCGSDGACAF